MKKLLVLALLVTGCGGPTISTPPPGKPQAAQSLDGANLAKQLAELQVATGNACFHEIYKTAAFDLLQAQDFKTLEEMLRQLGQRDPVETLCTPASLIYEMPELQAAVGSFPWFLYFSDRWEAETHSAYANEARAVALTSRGESLMAVTQDVKIPLWYQGKWYCEVGAKFAESVHKGDPGWPLCEMIQKVPSKGKRHAILSEIHEYPQEIALYLSLVKEFSAADRLGKGKLLKDLGTDSSANYALFFTIQLPKSGVRKINTDGWEWETLQAGFEQLLKEHPKALGVRNAYALAAHAFAKEEVLGEQLAKLGYLWDPGYWGSLAEYQRDLGSLPDCHLGGSELSPLALDKIFREVPFDGLAALQASDLKRKELWNPLEVYLAHLSTPERLLTSERKLEEPDGENEAAYQALEKQLKAWQQARPDSQVPGAILGGFYINYAWLARGSGTADTVTSAGWTKFNQRLKISRDLLYRVFGAGYQTPSVMANLMILYNAESGNLDSARKLAIKAAKAGRKGNAAILSYAQMLLPRWQGEPGDMSAAADMLRKEAGNDDCYALMTSVSIEAEGMECLEPGHPVAMDWKRAIQSVVDAGRAQRLSKGLARQFLHYCDLRNARQDAARILPYVPERYNHNDEMPPVLLTAEREWAAGRYGWPREKPKYTFTLNGPLRQKSGPDLKLGFTAHLNRPFAVGKTYVIQILGPTTHWEGVSFRDYLLTDALYPMVGTDLSCQPQADALGRYKVGRYVVRLFESDETLLHEETFEVLP